MKHADEVREAFADLCREINRFLQASAHAYPHLVEAIGRVRSAVQAARLPCLLPGPERLPGCRHLGAALKMAHCGPMASLACAFERMEPQLRWIRTEHYREALGDTYMANYGYTNLLGYDALVPHDRIIVAFLLIGPGHHYPRHHHAAEEIYFPLGGDTLWSQGDGEWFAQLAGEPIHNSPWLPHEMMTRTTPLLTLCCWISPGPIQFAQLTD